MIRSAKDIPAEIKSIVGKFYMNNAEMAKDAIVKLRADKPEYNNLLDNVEQLFENAPESVFMFYDELIALDNASEVMSPEIDFSIDSLMDEDEEGSASSKSEDGDLKLNLDDDDDPGSKKQKDEDKGSESEDKPELVKSCFSEIIESPSDDDSSDDKPFDISACLMTSGSSQSESEKDSDGDEGIKLVAESVEKDSEGSSATDDIEISIDFDDNDQAFKMPNLFADDEDNNADKKEDKKSSSDDDFSFSKVLEVPQNSAPETDSSESKSSDDGVKPSDDKSKDDEISFGAPILGTTTDEKKETKKDEAKIVEDDDDEAPFFPLIGKIDTKKSSASKVAEAKDDKKAEAKDDKKVEVKDDKKAEAKDDKKVEAKDDKKAEVKDEKVSENEAGSDDDDFEIPIFGIDLMSDDSDDEAEKEAKEKAEKEAKEKAEKKAPFKLKSPFGLPLKGGNKIFETATPIPNKFKVPSLADKDTPTPIPSKMSVTPRASLDTATPVPNKISKNDQATPIPDFMKRNRVSTRDGQSDKTPLPGQLPGFRKISAFSDNKGSEHKTAPVLQAVPTSSFFGVSVASLDEIKSKLGESTKKAEPVKKFEPLKREEPAKKIEPVKKFEPLRKLEPAKSHEPLNNDDATPLPGFQNSSLKPQKITSIALNAVKQVAQQPAPSKTPSGIIATDPVARLRPLTRIPRLVCKLSEIPKNVNINPKAGFLLSMIDGRTSISDILDISAWPEEETATLMLELEEQDVIFFR